MTDDRTVFISYAREDGRDKAERLYHALTGRGFKAWRDERNLDPYQDFSAEIEIAIRRSNYVAVCLTPSIAQNPHSFVRREILYALNREKPIIPLLFPGGEPPVQIAHLTYLPFFQPEKRTEVDFDGGVERLVERLGEQPAFEASPEKGDPYQDYLHALYEQIVNYLDSTVFSLIALHTKATPGAVARPREVRARALPMGFTGLSVKTSTSVPENVTPFKNFSEAFDHYKRRVLLLGEPGAGKTTTLMAYAREAVARRLADRSEPLPLLAPVAGWPAEPETPLTAWLGEINDYLDMATVERLIGEGKTLLLLDGLDELGGERVVETDHDKPEEERERYDPRARFMEALAACPESNRVLVTCRIRDYQEIGEKIQLQGAITLEPLDDSQMAEYLADHGDLLAAIQADPDLREMARTPLLLSLLTYAYSGIGERVAELRDLGHSRSELRDVIFKTYVARRYEHEQMKANRPLTFTLEQIYDVLGKVTVEMIGQKLVGRFSFAPARTTTHTVFSSQLVAEVLKRVLDALFKHPPISQEVVSFLELAQRLHLVTLADGESYRFIHLLVRDHFAATYSLIRLKKTQASRIGDSGRRFRFVWNTPRQLCPCVRAGQGDAGS